MHDGYVTIIKPKTGWQIIDFKELREYRDLIFFMVWREIKVHYAQTVLGLSWALLQPLLQIVIFTIVFGKVAKIDTDGIPYILFSTVAIIPWTYISMSLTSSSQSLVTGQNMLGKVYFPRLIFPLTPILSRMVDFVISFAILACVMIYYRVEPTMNLLLAPVFILIMMSTAAGAGMWLSAMAIRFRDVKHALPFIIRMLMYSAPIVYSASSLQGWPRLIYSLNPIVAIIEGFRSSFLGIDYAWDLIIPGSVTSLILLVSGAFYFKRMERVFVDVI
jgi:lipopolysaccharide transport system permease protein